MVLVYPGKRRRRESIWEFGNECTVRFHHLQFSWTQWKAPELVGQRNTMIHRLTMIEIRSQAEDGNSDNLQFSRWLPQRKGHLECNEMKSVEISSDEWMENIKKSKESAKFFSPVKQNYEKLFQPPMHTLLLLLCYVYMMMGSSYLLAVWLNDSIHRIEARWIDGWLGWWDEIYLNAKHQEHHFVIWGHPCCIFIYILLLLLLLLILPFPFIVELFLCWKSNACYSHGNCGWSIGEVDLVFGNSRIAKGSSQSIGPIQDMIKNLNST